jgi:chromosome segregation ATPase
MVEPIMYLAIGFLLAMLLALLFMPLVHHRAVRLTTRRLEAATPLSMAEIQADKDQLRAEFAMAARRLEMNVEQLRTRTATQLADLGKKSDAINRLKIELGDKNAAIFALEAREKALKDQQRATLGQVAAGTEQLRDAERQLTERQAELSRLTGELSQGAVTAAGREAELAAARARIEALQGRIGDAEKAVAQAKDAERLTAQVADLESRLAERDKTLAAQSKSLVEKDETLAEHNKSLTEHAHDNDMLRRQADAARQTEQRLREAVAAGIGAAATLETLRAEKAALEQQLAAARDERASLQRDLDLVRQQQAAAARAAEQDDSALLRERISDIAAEVAQLAATIEGPDSPIDAILAADAERSAGSAPAGKTAAQPNGAARAAANGSAAAAPRGTLAERIRMLQAQAARGRHPG